jgi:beta-lactamase class A
MKIPGLLAALLLLLLGAWLVLRPQPSHGWVPGLHERIALLDQRTLGELGVYIKHLGDGRELEYQAERYWYLASAIKAPVAVVVLQRVDAGELSLDEQLTLRETDKVDGAGSLVWQEAGSRYSIKTLLEEMLQKSDSTAADMLIRKLGESELNSRVQALGIDGFGRITRVQQVRYELYGELHPEADRLSNQDLVQLAGLPREQRAASVARLLGSDAQALDAESLEQAYQRYYDRRLNSSTLKAYGALLEKLVRGELLSAQSTEQLFKMMGIDQYHAYRLEAGLPRTRPFIHKTGTQFRRACHMGVIDPRQKNAIIVAACTEHIEQDEAAQVLKQLGRLITDHLLRPPPRNSQQPTQP